jgi:hypothetical protein
VTVTLREFELTELQQGQNSPLVVSGHVLQALKHRLSSPNDDPIISDMFHCLLLEFVYWDLSDEDHSRQTPALVWNLVAILTQMPVKTLRLHWVARMFANAGLIINNLPSTPSTSISRRGRAQRCKLLIYRLKDTDRFLLLGLASIVHASTSREDGGGDAICPADELEIVFQRLLELKLSWDTTDINLYYPLENGKNLNKYAFQAIANYHLRHASAIQSCSSRFLSASL